MTTRSRKAKPAPAPIDLPALRIKIDALDARIVDLLNQRSALVVDVGRYKQAHGIPIYAPHREAEVLSRVLAHNQGPLQSRTIEAVYRELMSGSFALERPLSIGYLGPAGSFSHAAAVRHFGSSVDFEDLHAIAGVFTEVARGHVDYGLVPIENSAHGGVTETLDALQEHGPAGKVHVYAEAQLAVHHTLAANCAPSAVKRIYSKPEVFSQCRAWLATQYPRAELAPTASSSLAMQIVAGGRRRGAPAAAAIGSTLAAELYGVNVLFEQIEDNPHNITRFFILSRTPAQKSGDDKTSIMFRTLNKPGALVSVLQDFERARINLTHIDKRPGGRVNWQYTFFIDAQGHAAEPAMKRALGAARRHCKELHVLGSYPRSTRVL